MYINSITQVYQNYNSKTAILAFSWEQRKVQDVADRFDNLRIPVAANLRVHGTTPYYGANGIQDYVEGFTHDGEFVLVAEDGANDLKNYPVKCVNGRIWVNNHAHVLQGKAGIADNSFLAFAISQSDIESLLVGGGRAKLNAETLMSIEFRLPCLQEQYRIGEYLTQLDHLITLHQRKYFYKLTSAGTTRTFQNTNAWEQRKVSDVAEIITGGTPSTTINEYWYPKQIPWLSSGEIHKKHITYTDDKISEEGLNHSSARIIKEDSILIALAGQGKTRGTVAINCIPLSTNQSIAAMTFDKEIYPEFIFANLENRYDEMRKLSSGDGSRGGLNKQLVGSIEIPYTSFEEQRAIGNYFSNLDHLITLHQRERILHEIQNN